MDKLLHVRNDLSSEQTLSHSPGAPGRLPTDAGFKQAVQLGLEIVTLIPHLIKRGMEPVPFPATDACFPHGQHAHVIPIKPSAAPA
jgi:hypothetical protein